MLDWPRRRRRYLLGIARVRDVLGLRHRRMVGVCAIVVVLGVRCVEVVRGLDMRVLRHLLHLGVREMMHELAGRLVLLGAHVGHRVAVAVAVPILLLMRRRQLMVAVLWRHWLVVVAIIRLPVGLLAPVVHRDMCGRGFHPVTPPDNDNNHLI